MENYIQVNNNRSYFLTIITIFLLLMFGQYVLAEGETLQVLNDTAVGLYEQGKYDEAAELAQRALRVAEDTFGIDNPKIVPFLNNLAVIYYGQGNYAESEAQYKRALALTEQAYGKDHARARSLREGLEKCRQKLLTQELPEESDDLDEIDALPDAFPPGQPAQEESPSVVSSPQEKSPVITNKHFLKKYTLQVGAFRELLRAKALQDKLDKNGYDVSLTTIQRENGETLHKVQTGEFSDRKKAEQLAQEIKTLLGLDPYITTK